MSTYIKFLYVDWGSWITWRYLQYTVEVFTTSPSYQTGYSAGYCNWRIYRSCRWEVTTFIIGTYLPMVEWALTVYIYNTILIQGVYWASTWLIDGWILKVIISVLLPAKCIVLSMVQKHLLEWCILCLCLFYIQIQAKLDVSPLIYIVPWCLLYEGKRNSDNDKNRVANVRPYVSYMWKFFLSFLHIKWLK